MVNYMVDETQWLRQIEQVCAQLNNFTVNVIIDQAGEVPSLVQDLKRFQPKISWVSLLENEPENEFIDDAPVYLQLQLDIWQHREWFSALLRQYPDPARVLLFFSNDSFSILSKHFQALIIAEWEGRKGLLRFYDARIFSVLVETILTEQQRTYFFGLVPLWSWRDRDGCPVWLQADNATNDYDENVMIELNDHQYSQLGLISDIEEFIRKHSAKYPQFTQQSLFVLLWESVQDEIDENIIDTEKHFLNYLSAIANEGVGKCLLKSDGDNKA